MQSAVKEVYVDQAVAEYIVRLSTATREHPDVYLGASPRAGIALVQGARTLAAFSGRDYAVPDDVVQLITASGAPDECRAKVQEYVDAGCTCPVLYPLGDDVPAMIEAFAAARV